MDDSITPIGISKYQNKEKPFGIKQQDRSGHIYCLGKTGTGKSTLLLNMAIADIQTGRGVGIIDPHGDLANTVLEYIPGERIQDVIYFNAADREYFVAFNPLYKVSESNRFLTTDNIVSVFKKLWPDSWGPRLEHILRFTVLSLLYYPHATLLDIQPMLTSQGFRHQVLSFVTDKAVLQFWQREYEPLLPQVKNEIISPILNKVGILTGNAVIRNIIGSRVSSFTVSEIMNRKKIFIANLSKGYLGETGTAFLGSLLVSQFQTASLERARLSPENRQTFYLYIDEMQSFITLAFTSILSESRKYGLSLFLTHQFLDQLHQDIRKAVLGNVGTLISFRIGAVDAEILEQEFYPVFTRYDLISLPQFHIYLKLLIDGTQSMPFSGITMTIAAKKYLYTQECIQLSRKKYTMPEENSIGKTDKDLSDTNAGCNYINQHSLFG